MATKRMLSQEVVCSDVFLGLQHSTQALYLQLSVRADDDGFVNSVRAIMAITATNEENLLELEDKGFVIRFQSGVLVIRHWKVNNYLRADRYTPTAYQEEKSLLTEDTTKAYVLKKKSGNLAGIPSGAPNGIPSGCVSGSIDKNRIDKNRIDKKEKINKKESEKISDKDIDSPTSDEGLNKPPSEWTEAERSEFLKKALAKRRGEE